MSTTLPPAQTIAPRPLSSHPPREPLMEDEPRTLVEVIERACLRHRLPDAFNYKRDGAWRSISSEEFLARSRRVARALRGLGVRPGDRVAILSESCPEWVLADVGCMMAGAVDVPIYPTLAPGQVCYIINDSGARVLFVQNAEVLERIRDSISDCSTLEHFVVMLGDAGSGDDDKVLTLAQLEERGGATDGEAGGDGDALSHAARAEELATIIYTSGTTGEPKGVMLTHSNVVSNLIDTSDRLAFSRDDTVLSVLPLSHIFERGAMYMYIHHGSRVFFSESMEKIGENIREVRPTALVAVPRLYEKIYARIKDKAAAGGRLKSAMLSWAVEVGKRWARASMGGGRPSGLLALKHKVATRLVFSKWREGVGGR
ncbi:MAG TPA: AMP-binding protein, partial [Pyrinomonadaceae bacterium]|nr:AMP-binding protein [Pyrinomonadaceae bacterium]